MEALKSFAVLLLFVSAACCIYYFLLPGGNVSKTAKKLLAVFFLFCVSAPLFSLWKTGFDPGTWELPEETAAVTADAEPFAAAGEAAVRREAARILDAGASVPYTLRVETHIEDGPRINIQQVTVIFERDFAGRADVIAELTAALGAPVKWEVQNADGAVETSVDETGGG